MSRKRLCRVFRFSCQAASRLRHLLCHFFLLRVWDRFDVECDACGAVVRRFLASFLAIRAELPGGRWGERVAVRFLRRRGLQILERNYHGRYAEIDIIGLERERLIFVEVKTHHRLSRSWGLDRIDVGKTRRIEKLASHYLAIQPDRVQGWRFDAVVVVYDRGRFGQRRVCSTRWIPSII